MAGSAARGGIRLGRREARRSASAWPAALVGARRGNGFHKAGELGEVPASEQHSRYLDHWHRIGIVVQAPAIVIDTTLSLHLDVDWYLEVESQLSDTGKTPVVPYPNFDSGG